MTDVHQEEEQDVFVVPTSFAQQSMWLENELDPGQATYHVVAAVRLAVGEVATRDYLRRELVEVIELLNELKSGQDDSTR